MKTERWIKRARESLGRASMYAITAKYSKGDEKTRRLCASVGCISRAIDDIAAAEVEVCRDTHAGRELRALLGEED